MRPHLSILAALHAAQGLFALGGAAVVLVTLVATGTLVGVMPDVPGWVGALVGTAGAFVALFLAALALPGLALAYGLFARKAWARPLGLVVGALSLLNFPFGTAIGVYTLWALLKPETAALLGERADAAYR